MLKQFLKDEQGQTTVEYLLIIGVVVVVISVLGKQMQQRLPDLVATVFKGVNAKVNELMSGSGG